MCVAQLGDNVVGVEHHREGVRVDLGDVDVTLQVETKGPAHIADLLDRLAKEGYSIQRL